MLPPVPSIPLKRDEFQLPAGRHLLADGGVRCGQLDADGWAGGWLGSEPRSCARWCKLVLDLMAPLNAPRGAYRQAGGHGPASAIHGATRRGIGESVSIVFDMVR